ncbi:hypothetical protein GLOIN_2v1848749 [Rhizophagus clarus]|uniref:Uncharacterized protein n=1 Tax=Rhizophagus clarus TaxID=94130 RepID=A0A8H3R8B4_9GLOM|nr:hypothetical protein GLOIN_2v1848749 [Rhizophagus clarus]
MEIERLESMIYRSLDKQYSHIHSKKRLRVPNIKNVINYNWIEVRHNEKCEYNVNHIPNHDGNQAHLPSLSRYRRKLSLSLTSYPVILSYKTKKRIFEEVQKKNDNIFSDIKANDLELWMVKIRNDSEDDFLNLVLDEKNEGMKLLEEYISECWDEKILPKKGMTHVIVNSPLLLKNQELERTNQELERMNREMDQLVQQTADLSINPKHVGFTKFGDMLAELKSRPVFYGKTILQLAFRNGYIHEEGWAYIEYKKLFHPSVNTFVKTLLNLSNSPGPDQLKRFSVGNISYDDMPRRERRRNLQGVVNRQNQDGQNLLDNQNNRA